MMQNRIQQETFFTELNTNLECYFDMKKDTVPQVQMYPLQCELRSKTDRYINPELIGEGSKKYIYKVIDTKTNRPVAKAILKDENNQEGIEQFLREARLTSLLEHPNIIPIYDIDLELDKPFFTMELLKGDMLSTIIKKLCEGSIEYKRKYTQETILEIFTRICDAMTYAHSAQVIHLDLKPDNIHVGEFGNIHICDWGLAKITTEDDYPETFLVADPNEFNNMTLNGQIKGTPGYMAPEQCVINGEKDHRTDIYTLGALLYSLLTYNITLHNSSDMKTALQKTINGEISPPHKIATSQYISPRLEAIVMKALTRDPDKRYQSVENLRADLSNYQLGYAISAETAGFLTHTSLLIKRHSIISSIATVSLMTVTILTITFITQLTNKEENAVMAHKKTKEALTMLQKETKENQKLNNELLMLMIDGTKVREFNSKLNTIPVINHVLRTDITDTQKETLWFRKGIILLTHQRFKKAMECFDQCDEILFNYHKIIMTCREITRTKGENYHFNSKELAAIIIKMGKQAQVISYLLYENHMRYMKENNIKEEPEEYFPLASAMLSITNNRWKPLIADSNLKKVEKGYSLNLSNNPHFRYFSSPLPPYRNYLTALNLRSLDLSKSVFHDISQLKGLKRLHTLNISECRIRHLGKNRCNHLKWIGVKTLLVTPQDHGKRLYKFLADHNIETIDGTTMTKVASRLK